MIDDRGGADTLRFSFNSPIFFYLSETKIFLAVRRPFIKGG